MWSSFITIVKDVFKSTKKERVLPVNTTASQMTKSCCCTEPVVEVVKVVEELVDSVVKAESLTSAPLTAQPLVPLMVEPIAPVINTMINVPAIHTPSSEESSPTFIIPPIATVVFEPGLTSIPETTESSESEIPKSYLLESDSESEAIGAPEVPEALGAPEAPEASEVPEAPEASEVPEAPEAPETLPRASITIQCNNEQCSDCPTTVYSDEVLGHVADV